VDVLIERIEPQGATAFIERLVRERRRERGLGIARERG